MSDGGASSGGDEPLADPAIAAEKQTPEPTPDAGAPPPRRRRFLDMALGGSAAMLGAGAVYPVLRFLEPSELGSASVAVAKADALPPGGSALVALGGEPVLLLRTAEGEVRAFVASCPHLGCVVRYAADHQLIECGCHGGRFAPDGRRIAGPSPRSLSRLRVEQVGGEIVITRG